VNPLEVVRWNTDKRYLVELARAGVPVVPTRFVSPGADAAAELERFLAGGDSFTGGRSHEFTDYVVKPAIGAASRDAARYARTGRAQGLAHLTRLLEAGREAMLQPYQEHVDTHGETAVMFFDGTLSHAVRKEPQLRAGAGPVSRLFALEQITPREIDAEERRAAERLAAAILERAAD
jgi:O-ureido-D-serine cyclo-ligase